MPSEIERLQYERTRPLTQEEQISELRKIDHALWEALRTCELVNGRIPGIKKLEEDIASLRDRVQNWIE